MSTLPVMDPKQVEQIRSRLIGTWKLVSSVREAIPSGEKVNLLGPSPVGYINYSRDGRMLVLIVRSDRNKPAGSIANAAEAEALFRSMNAYGGTWTIDSDSQITHHVDISWNEHWTGTEQTRLFKFEGNRVTLSTKPSNDPLEGVFSARTMVWQKLKQLDRFHRPAIAKAVLTDLLWQFDAQQRASGRAKGRAGAPPNLS